MTNKYAKLAKFEDPFTLTVVEEEEPHAGPGQVRVRVAAVGLNPLDWKVAANAQMAAAFGVNEPTGFGLDMAGTVDEVGEGVEGFAVGDRVFGQTGLGRAAAQYVVIDTPEQSLLHTPDKLSEELAAGLPVVAKTADGSLTTIGLTKDDTVLIGGAAGGVGTIAVQLASRLGATVIGTASEKNHEYLRSLGALPTTYGPGLVDRVRELAPNGVTAALDFHGADTAEAAVTLGVSPERIGVIAGGDDYPAGVRETGAARATEGALARIADLVAQGDVMLPIEQVFSLDDIQDAVALLRGGHVRGKVIVRI
ncbi:NADP-dependent oxidoreductase [Cutibacterium equinum]|uniref:NADP-dependent oxidoreductase n=1 Tax=Cutibacterium equinum TaxID=3016342 RepID=A0ABY7QXH0_9ACTN|nr:NADP-dependent oxidoreductase [Cutibacterium equinum]WCC79696.1 NADP-dependent oxidoreductase [Cutibacterium equinum]